MNNTRIKKEHLWPHQRWPVHFQQPTFVTAKTLKRYEKKAAEAEIHA